MITDPIWRTKTDGPVPYDVAETLDRYEWALRRIAEADETAHPLVKIALEALYGQEKAST